MEKYNLHSLCRLYVVVSLSHDYNTSLCGVYRLLSAYVFIVYRTYVINVLYGIITNCIYKFVYHFIIGVLCSLTHGINYVCHADLVFDKKCL